MADSDVTMKFHRFNQFFLLPISMIGYIFEIVRIVKSSEQFFGIYGTEISVAYVSFISIALLLNAVTQIGFVRLSGYSYYTYLSIQMFNMTISVFMHSYIYNKKIIYNMLYALLKEYPDLNILRDTGTISDFTDYFRTVMVFGIIFGLIISILIIFYYMNRKHLFSFREQGQRKKRKNDPWANTERYVPGRGVKIPKKEEQSIANRRLTGLSGNKDLENKEEPDIFDGLK